MSIYNIGFNEKELIKITFCLSSNFIKYTPYLFCVPYDIVVRNSVLTLSHFAVTFHLT